MESDDEGTLHEQGPDPVEEQPADEGTGESLDPVFGLQMPGEWMPGLPPIAPIIEPAKSEDEDA